MTRAGRLALAVILLLAAGCAEVDAPDGTPDPFAGLAPGHPLVLPAVAPVREGRPGQDGGTIFDPASAPIRDGVAYAFSLGHCGLQSPVDVDGAFWNPMDGVGADGRALDFASDGEMINATAGVIVVVGDELRFRTESGAIVRFGRHEGAKEFPGCM